MHPLFAALRRTLILVLFAVVPGLPQTNSGATQSPTNIDPQIPKELDPLLRKFIDVFAIVQASMLRTLDPHTQFFDPGQFEQLRQMEASEQKGFGSIVSVLPGQVIFLQTLPGTPSSKAGIQAGDELVGINNIAIRTLEPEQIIELLTEARQQKISVFVRRQESAKLLQFFLTPELVDAPSVDRVFVLQPGFGYIRIASWDLQTSKQLSDALAKLDATHLQGLILDLRNNPGGVVTAALEAAAQFLPPGSKILTARGRSTDVSTAAVPATAKPFGMKVAVLINAKTASASEILAGALQDHDRAIIVGKTSFGKGLVQSVLPLSGNAGLAITTAFYYTPSGRSIQHPLKDSALSQTFSNDHPAPQPVFKTDRGRTVIGGGGIQPDLRVADEPATRLEAVLGGSGALTAFATQYLSGHARIPDPFLETTDMLDEFKVFLTGRNIDPNVSEWTAERNWLIHHLQAEIITQAKGVAKGDEIEASFNPQIQAALRAMQTNEILAGIHQ